MAVTWWHGVVVELEESTVRPRSRECVDIVDRGGARYYGPRRLELGVEGDANVRPNWVTSGTHSPVFGFWQ